MSAHAGLLGTSVGHGFCPTWSLLPLAMPWPCDIWYVLCYINLPHRKKRKASHCACHLGLELAGR